MSGRWRRFRGLLVGLLALIAVAGSLRWLAARVDRADLLDEQATLLSEIEMRDAAGSKAGSIAVQAHFATWADLIEALHRASMEAGLMTFAYRTEAPVAVLDPSAPLFESDDDQELLQDDLEDEAPQFDSVAPYRALVAVAEGRGSYPSIARFSRAIVEGPMPLSIDRLEVVADGVLPRFVARLHLDTALPYQPPVGETLAGRLDSATEDTGGQP